VWALVSAGAEVAIWNRTPEKADRLAREFGAAVAERVDVADFDLLVNATTVGMGSSTQAFPDLKRLPVDADALGERHQLVDLAYGAADTELVRAARARGARVVDGLEVLVRQGAASLRIWTGLDPPIEVMRRAARADRWQTTTDPDT
jgi:shikimate dehydrogenase